MDDFDIFETNESDEDEITAGEVLRRLESAWQNEVLSPELLEHQNDIVECMIEQLNAMESNIKRCRRTDFKISLHKLEIDRIKYVISSYLRARLEKIEKNATFFLQNEPESAKLSSEELAYAKEYSENLNGHFNNVVLRHLPPGAMANEQKKMVSRPFLDKYVFLRVQQDVEGVLIEGDASEHGEEILDLKSGDQHLMRFEPISSLVKQGSVMLI